ncbi:hypothetical protein SRHO_G00132370 [Serrasalmus rhombeus]
MNIAKPCISHSLSHAALQNRALSASTLGSERKQPGRREKRNFDRPGDEHPSLCRFFPSSLPAKARALG